MSNRGGGSGGGGRSGYEGFSRESHPPPTAPPTMASSGSIESSLNRETERLSLSEKKPVVVTPGSSSANAPAPVDAPPQSSKSIGFPTRQGFEVTDKDLCHYDVAIAPETTLRNLNRSIITELVKLFQHSELGGQTPAYDGCKSLYTAGQLPFTSKTFEIKLPEIDPKANGREKEFSVTIKFSAKADLYHLQQFLQRRQSDLSPQETIHALDVILRESPCTNTGDNPDLGAGVEYCRGFYQSLRPTQMGLSLNIDICDFSRPLGDHDRIKLKKVLRGVQVETTHNPDCILRATCKIPHEREASILQYHDSGEQKSCQPSVGQWKMMKMKMVNGGTVNNWACLNFSRTSEREVIKFCDDLVAMCNRKGMVFNTRPCINLTAANPTNLEAALRNLHQRASSNVPNGQLDLVIIILPEIRGSSYGMIKKVFETELGIVSQCCAPKQVSRCNQQYLENISLKINVKVGGRNTDALSKSQLIPNSTDRPTINFGADVTHPDPGEASSSSIAAVVASMEPVICEDLIANLTNNERGQKLKEEENSFIDDELYDGANYDLGLEDESMEEEPMEEEPTEEEPMEEDDSGYGRTSSGTNSYPTEEEGSKPTGENFPTGPYNSLTLSEEFARQDRIHEEEEEEEEEEAAYLSALADPNQAPSHSSGGAELGKSSGGS